MMRLRQTRNRSGQAMVVCLIAIGFLTAMVGATSMILLTHSRLATYEQNRLAAFYLARSGLAKGKQMLLEDDPALDTLSDRWHGLDNQGTWDLENGEFGLGTWSTQPESPGSAIVDEERKLNLNAATPAMLRSLSPALTDEIVEQIATRRQQRPFASLNEITGLPDVSPSTLRTRVGEEQIPLRDLLTVHGNGKVNVNTAPYPVIESIEGLSSDQADQIMQYRRGKDGTIGTQDDRPFESLEAVRSAINLSDDVWPEVRPFLSVNSTCFTIHSWGRSAADPVASVELREVVRRSSSGLTVLEFREATGYSPSRGR